MNKLLYILFLFIFINVNGQLPSWISNTVIIEDDSPGELAKYPSTAVSNTAYLFRAGVTFNVTRDFSVAAEDVYIGSTDYNGDSLAYIVTTATSGRVISGVPSYNRVYVKNLSIDAPKTKSLVTESSGVKCIDIRNLRNGGATDSDVWIENVHIYGGLSGMNIGSYGASVGETTDYHLNNVTIRRVYMDGVYSDNVDSVYISNVRIDSVNMNYNINSSWIAGDAIQVEVGNYVNVQNSYLSHEHYGGKFAFIVNGALGVDAYRTHFIGQDISGTGTTVYVGYNAGVDIWNFIDCIFEGGATGLSKHSNTMNFYNCVFKGYTSSALVYQSGSYGFSPSYIDSCTFIDNSGTTIVGNTLPDQIFVSNCIFDNSPNQSTGTGVTMSNNTITTPTYLNAVYNTTLDYGAYIDINNFGYGTYVPTPTLPDGKVYLKRGNVYFYILSNSEPITDYDGNVYTSVIIGNQEWLGENLKTTHFNNGDAIPNISSSSNWPSGFTSYAWANYSVLNKSLGAFYNVHVLDDIRSLCPQGYRIPTVEEITTLKNFLAGGVLPTTEGDWVSGFITNNGNYETAGASGGGLLCTQDHVAFCIISGSSQIISDVLNITDNGLSSFGFNIRCIKDI